ncbi:hypothetical protein [Chlorogloea sp. CCALA 695]|uniref:hypothetical protein n=1 Tax=Chlorogloea sp. CCALA 695 TaxID=2107693 RepID=UPI000D0581AE|nr:hypothetical protein [Chlorogloea sp. CCALA 695]PSB28370.1 hypothetical protein C7B70_21180 [Chlorogloea sp. CCALA 695]
MCEHYIKETVRGPVSAGLTKPTFPAPTVTIPVELLQKLIDCCGFVDAFFQGIDLENDPDPDACIYLQKEATKTGAKAQVYLSQAIN